MKKKALALLGAILILSSSAACQNKADSQSDSVSIINFTDTGENSSNIASKRTDIEYSPSDDTVTSQISSEDISKDSDKTDGRKSSDSDTKGKKSDNNTSHSSDVTLGANSDSDNRSNNNSNSSVRSDVNSNTNQNDNSRPQNTSSDSDTVSTDTSSDISTDISPDTDTDTSQPSNEEPVETGEFSEKDIAFFINGTRILLGEELGAVVEILGEPDTIDSDESGIVSMTYNYPGFWVKFVKSENSEILTVDAIQIYSDEFETEKGVKVFMSLDEAKRVYGECSTVIDNEYRYYVGNIYMYFYAPNGTVANIGYNIDYNVEHENS